MLGDASPKIVDAALFKNGFAMVTREIEVSGGDTSIMEIPQAALGTFWVAASEGVKVKEIISTKRDSETTVTVSSFGDALSRNIGKSVSIQTVNLGSMMGVVKAVNELLVLEVGDATKLIPMGEIRSVQFNGTPTLSFQAKQQTPVLTFKTEGKGKLQIFGLERGLSWAPGYALTLEGKTATLNAKATVMNDLGELNVNELRFVTGYPNVPFSAMTEPLLTQASLDQFVNNLGAIGSGGGFANRRDFAMQTANAAPAADFGGAWETSTLAGFGAEDLFFYRQMNVNLKRGDRALYALFTAKSDFEHLYTADLPGTDENARPSVNENAVDVWHTIKFTNKAGQPLTTGPLSVYKDGQILGQDTLTYTSAGAEANVKISKALDVSMSAYEEELDRKRQALRIYSGDYDLVTLTGTIEIVNRKAESLKLRIRKPITGEVTKADDEPKATKPAKGLRAVNPTSQLEWNLDLKAGAKKTLTYTYTLYQRA